MISFAGDTINPSSHMKTLGVYMDHYLTFDVHVSELSKKVVRNMLHITRLCPAFEK